MSATQNDLPGFSAFDKLDAGCVCPSLTCSLSYVVLTKLQLQRHLCSPSWRSPNDGHVMLQAMMLFGAFALCISCPAVQAGEAQAAASCVQTMMSPTIAVTLCCLCINSFFAV